MDKTRHLHFAPLLKQLQQRAERSIVSQFAFRSPALTDYLRDQYSQAPGKAGSLLATPVFEPTFSWQSADKSMEELRDKLISSYLVKALGISSPFKHQLAAWRAILEDKAICILGLESTFSAVTARSLFRAKLGRQETGSNRPFCAKVGWVWGWLANKPDALSDRGERLEAPQAV